MKRRRFFITSVLSGMGVTLNAMSLRVSEFKKDQEMVADKKKNIPLNNDYDVIIIGGGLQVALPLLLLHVKDQRLF